MRGHRGRRRGGRVPKRATLAAQRKANEGRRVACDALGQGRRLRISNRTTDSTIHAGLARRLLVEGRAIRVNGFIQAPPTGG